jgi:hypothetical protein
MSPQIRDQIQHLSGQSPLSQMRWKSIPAGAATSVWCAVVADAPTIGGQYCEDCHVADVVPDDYALSGGVRAYAVNPDRARALWSKSEQMVGEHF